MAEQDALSPLLDVVSPLPVPRKAALCLGADFWHTAPVPEIGLEPVMMSDGPHGLRKQPDRSDHAGLTGSVPATCFPTASATGSCWDPALIREMGVALGEEARAQDIAVVLGPGVNIKRSPLCGRNFEYFSEDPWLAGRLAAAMVEGLQSQQVGACVKHFAANNQETDRLRVSADIDERTLREIYLPAFEHVVTAARPWLVMCAYNKLNGEFAAHHRWLLTELLRDEWGFGGLVVSDWGAVHDRVAALAAGLDLEMPPNLGVSDVALAAAVADGRLDEALLDRSAARVVQLVHRARRREPAELDAAAHHELARRVAADSMVLLKNAGEVLPLADAPGLTVAVIGEFARRPRFQGGGSSAVNPLRADVPLDALAAALPQATIRFAAGFSIDGEPATPGEDVAGTDLAGTDLAGTDLAGTDLAGEAVRAATGADVIVAFLGLPQGAESEGYDRDHIDLPASQISLVLRLAAALPGTPLVAVLQNGSAVAISGWDHAATAVLECWLAGQAAGTAIADVLTGAVSPSGRLAETIPLRLADCPSFLNFPGEEGHVRYGEGVFVGYRGYDAAGKDVGYPFGHGLSYTTFGYRGLTVTASAGPEVVVTCAVRNTGQRAGREVVQLYVGDPQAWVARPPRELKGFTKISLQPGEERAVSFTLTARDLSYWSVARGGWVLEPGEFRIEVGASSRDIRLAEVITVAGQPRRDPLGPMSTLAEWLADPDGGPALRAAVSDSPDLPAGILANPELLKIVGNFPLATLAAFPGLGITQKLVDMVTGWPGYPGHPAG